GVVDVAAGEEDALPFRGKMRGADDVRAARFAAARVFPNLIALAVAIAADHLGQRPVDAAVVARAHEHLAPIGPDEAPRVLRFGGAAVKGSEPALARAVAPEAGFIERHDAVGRLDPRVRVQPLREKEFAAGRPAEGV